MCFMFACICAGPSAAESYRKESDEALQLLCAWMLVVCEMVTRPDSYCPLEVKLNGTVLGKENDISVHQY